MDIDTIATIIMCHYHVRRDADTSPGSVSLGLGRLEGKLDIYIERHGMARHGAIHRIQMAGASQND